MGSSFFFFFFSVGGWSLRMSRRSQTPSLTSSQTCDGAGWYSDILMCLWNKNRYLLLQGKYHYWSHANWLFWTERDQHTESSMYKSICLSCNDLECWLSISYRVDQAGVICKQEGIFRVNCMDCLDRTNVVQAAIARVVMEKQVCKTTIVLWLHDLCPVPHWPPPYLSVLCHWFSWTTLLFACL